MHRFASFSLIKTPGRSDNISQAAEVHEKQAGLKGQRGATSHGCYGVKKKKNKATEHDLIEPSDSGQLKRAKNGPLNECHHPADAQFLRDDYRLGCPVKCIKPHRYKCVYIYIHVCVCGVILLPALIISGFTWHESVRLKWSGQAAKVSGGDLGPCLPFYRR